MSVEKVGVLNSCWLDENGGERGRMRMKESERGRKLKEAEMKLTEATRGRMKAHVASEAEVFFAAFRSLSCSGPLRRAVFKKDGAVQKGLRFSREPQLLLMRALW